MHRSSWKYLVLFQKNHSVIQYLSSVSRLSNFVPIVSTLVMICDTYLYILKYKKSFCKYGPDLWGKGGILPLNKQNEKSWYFFSAEDSGVSSGAVPSAPPLPTISENEEEEPLLEEDFSVALLEDDQRDFEAGMVVSTSKVGILWGKKSLNSLRFSLMREIRWFNLHLDFSRVPSSPDFF